MKIYTRTGDAGSTGLFGGPRVSKDDSRIEAYGTVDELNATIGMVRSVGVTADVDSELDAFQHELFSIGAELAAPDPNQFDLRVIGASQIDRLEAEIDRRESSLAPLKQFILPGGSAAAAHLHLARAVCRRAERRVVTLSHHEDASVSDSIIVYLNRLSDYLFVVSRDVNRIAEVNEVKWVRPSSNP